MIIGGFMVWRGGFMHRGGKCQHLLLGLPREALGFLYKFFNGFCAQTEAPVFCQTLDQIILHDLTGTQVTYVLNRMGLDGFVRDLPAGSSLYRLH